MLKINTALVLIDVQVGFDDPVWGERNNPDAEQHIGELLTHWRRAGRPVIHVQHLSTLADSPLRPDRSGNAFKPEALPLPDEALFQKSVNSAFIGTDLQGYLKRQRVTGIVLVGLTTDHCVSTTARMGANLGFAVTVVEDAVATVERSFRGKHYPAGLIHETALASLAVEFAEVVAAAELLL